jgi:hypothetical protein
MDTLMQLVMQCEVAEDWNMQEVEPPPANLRALNQRLANNWLLGKLMLHLS